MSVPTTLPPCSIFTPGAVNRAPRALVGRYMKNNQSGQIVPITAYTQDGHGERVAYKSRTRTAWVNVARLKTADEDGNRKNGYTLLPADYRAEGIDVA